MVVAVVVESGREEGRGVAMTVVLEIRAKFKHSRTHLSQHLVKGTEINRCVL
jgi:hypothetical protein